jgi:hypothetical protein
MKYDLRGSCRSCGTKIATVEKPGVQLAIPKTWGELWPTLVFSGILLVIGAALVGGGAFMLSNFPTGRSFAFLTIFAGGGFVLGAGKCWLK